MMQTCWDQPEKILKLYKKMSRTKYQIKAKNSPTNHLVFCPLVFCLHADITSQALLNWWMHFIPPIKSLQKFPKSSTTSSWYANLSTVVSWKHMWPHIITSSSETFHEYEKRRNSTPCIFFLTGWQQRFEDISSSLWDIRIKKLFVNSKHSGKEGLLARMGKTSRVLDILHELFVHQPNWKNVSILSSFSFTAHQVSYVLETFIFSVISKRCTDYR